MKIFKWALLIFSLNVANSYAATYVSKNFTILRALDKVTGRYTNLEVPVGGSAKFGSLSINVRTCKATPPEEAPENAAFLDVADIKEGKEPVDVFRGWMFSSSPALSAMEHPIYDIWVIKCDNRDGIKINPEATQYQGPVVDDDRPKELEVLDVSGNKNNEVNDVEAKAKEEVNSEATPVVEKAETKGFLSDVKVSPDAVKPTEPESKTSLDGKVTEETLSDEKWVDSEAQGDDENSEAEAPMPKAVDKLAEPVKDEVKQAPAPVNIDDEKYDDEAEIENKLDVEAEI